MVLKVQGDRTVKQVQRRRRIPAGLTGSACVAGVPGQVAAPGLAGPAETQGEEWAQGTAGADAVVAFSAQDDEVNLRGRFRARNSRR